MNKTTGYLLLLALSGWTLISCVSQNRFKESQQLTDFYRMEIDSLRGLTESGINESEFNYDQLKKEKKSTEMDLTVLQENYDNLKSYNNEILRKYDELLLQNKDLLNSSSTDVQQMVSRLSQAQSVNDQQARLIQRLESQIQSLQTDLSTARNTVAVTPPPPAPEVEVRTVVTNDCGEYQRQVNELNRLLADKENRLNGLRSKVNQALLGFTDADLSVTERNGKIYVSLSQNLLFASNSDNIDWKGKKAIRSLAEVLKQNPDINITVEGHTDPDGSAAKNWDLSVRRATAVVKILTETNVKPDRITASGRSFYYPIASNATAAGKAKNRRTEIILSPRLDQLYKIINE